MTTRHCWGCGKEVDVEELSILQCDGAIAFAHETLRRLSQYTTETRLVVACIECVEALQPDMWISDACWERIKAKVPYERLPEDEGQYDKMNRVEAILALPDLITQA